MLSIRSVAESKAWHRTHGMVFHGEEPVEIRSGL